MSYLFPAAFHDSGRFSWLRALGLIALALYTLPSYTLSISMDAMDRLIHLPNLIFHEAWHAIFAILWPWMALIGGSLMQLIVPFGITLVFLWQEDDPFAAAVALWWWGMSLMDLAVYIDDASARSLPLIGGMSEDAHDWGNILTQLNLLEYDHAFGMMTHILGLTCITGALWWAIWVLVNGYFSEKNRVVR